MQTKFSFRLGSLLGCMFLVVGAGCASSPVSQPPVSPTNSSASSTPSTPSTTPRTDAPLYFTTMTHMEGSFVDDKDRAVFDRHIEQLRHALELAKQHDAKITIESERPFALASKKWGVNVLQEFVDAGMGVGTHCDIPPQRTYTTEELTQQLRLRKQLVDTLVGAHNNRGCSGAGASADWATAMINAGFVYIDGLVGFHYLSMPLTERPDGWTNDYIQSTTYHDPAPEDLFLRYHPFFVKDASDFVPDADGRLLVSAGTLGPFRQLAEDVAGTAASCSRKCPLEKNDVDALIAGIQNVAAKHDGSAIGKIDVHIAAEDWNKENDEVLVYFFEQVNLLVDEGLIQWATQGEVYDAINAWQGR